MFSKYADHLQYFRELIRRFGNDFRTRLFDFMLIQSFVLTCDIQKRIAGWLCAFLKRENLSRNKTTSSKALRECEVFEDFHDSILIVDSAQKKISSTVGHSLMNDNVFASGRYMQANDNIKQLLLTLKSGNLNDFIKIVESEALTLHSMMMTSSPYFLLMKPNTISIIEKIWEYRKETDIPVCFTLDAGPNVHLLYPVKYASEVKKFIDDDLLNFTFNNIVINDKIGRGPERIIE